MPYMRINRNRDLNRGTVRLPYSMGNRMFIRQATRTEYHTGIGGPHHGRRYDHLGYAWLEQWHLFRVSAHGLAVVELLPGRGDAGKD